MLSIITADWHLRVYVRRLTGAGGAGYVGFIEALFIRIRSNNLIWLLDSIS